MKKILFLTSKGGPHSNTTLLVPQISARLKDKSIQIDTDTYGSLEYKIMSQKASIYSEKNKMDIKNYDLVVPLAWRLTPEQANSCMMYLSKNKTKTVTSEISNFRSTSKLAEYFKFWQENIPVPNTIYSKNTNIVRMLSDGQLKFPLVVKGAFEHKGELNFLAHDINTARDITRAHKSERFVFQEFIPNFFDYRIIAFGYIPKLAFKRQRNKSADSHLNNTSQGAKAIKVPLSKINPQILKDVERACRSMKRSIAGADVLIDSNTQKHYFLEINAWPQLRTGSFVEEKLKLYAEYLMEKVK